jgi:cytoskeletal protein RodZ
MKWQIHKQEQAEQICSFEQQRVEKIAEIGTKLRNLREEYGFDIDQVVAYTKIPRRLVQAIEEGDLNDLPEPIYIQGLIKLYADALGLDGNELSTSFPTDSSDFQPKSKWSNTALGQLRPSHLYLIYIGLIVCSVSGLSQVLNVATFQGSNGTQKNQPQETLVKSTQANSHLDLQTVSNQLSAEKPDEKVQVGVTLKDSSWIRVEVDGKTEFEGTLPQGTQRIWKAQDHLTVRAGNAGGVLLSVNKEQAKPLGEPGKIKELTIAANTHS